MGTNHVAVLLLTVLALTAARFGPDFWRRWKERNLTTEQKGWLRSVRMATQEYLDADRRWYEDNLNPHRQDDLEESSNRLTFIMNAARDAGIPVGIIKLSSNGMSPPSAPNSRAQPVTP